MKHILITGSTDGIGKLAALKLAKDGHHIYLHGRNAEKLTLVTSELKNASNNSNISGFVADFSDLDAVQQLATQIINEVPQLDILINNAGVFNSPVAKTKDGFDIRFVVNYFAPYLLTNQLLPLLEQQNSPRIINLSSAAQSTISFEALKGKTEIDTRAAYAQSKLAITMWSFYLAKKYPEICVIPVNPGSLLNTNMVREAFGRFWSSADKGGDIIYDLAVGEKHRSKNGNYFDNDQGAYGQAHADAYDEGLISQLIQETEEIL